MMGAAGARRYERQPHRFGLHSTEVFREAIVIRGGLDNSGPRIVRSAASSPLIIREEPRPSTGLIL